MKASRFLCILLSVIAAVTFASGIEIVHRPNNARLWASPCGGLSDGENCLGPVAFGFAEEVDCLRNVTIYRYSLPTTLPHANLTEVRFCLPTAWADNLDQFLSGFGGPSACSSGQIIWDSQSHFFGLEFSCEGSASVRVEQGGFFWVEFRGVQRPGALLAEGQEGRATLRAGGVCRELAVPGFSCSASQPPLQDWSSLVCPLIGHSSGGAGQSGSGHSSDDQSSHSSDTTQSSHSSHSSDSSRLPGPNGGDGEGDGQTGTVVAVVVVVVGGVLVLGVLIVVGGTVTTLVATHFSANASGGAPAAAASVANRLEEALHIPGHVFSSVENPAFQG